MRQLLFLPAAQNDLEGIIDYTFETHGSDLAYCRIYRSTRKWTSGQRAQEKRLVMPQP